MARRRGTARRSGSAIHGARRWGLLLAGLGVGALGLYLLLGSAEPRPREEIDDDSRARLESLLEDAAEPAP